MKNLLIGVAFLGLGIALGLRAREVHRTAVRHAALYDTGMRGVGYLLTPSQSGRPLGRDYTAYTYEVDGRSYTVAARRVASEEGLRLELGHRVPIWYDPADPAVSVSAPERSTWESDRLWTPLLEALGAIAFVLIGLAFFRAAFGDRKKPTPPEIPSWAPGVVERGRPTTRIPKPQDPAETAT